LVKYILGIQSFANANSGASIIKFDDKNKFVNYVAISEERLLRKKNPYTFPLHSIKYCLDHFNLKNLNCIDLIATDWIRERKWLRSGPAFNYQLFDYIKEKLNYKKKIIIIDHHLAHAASVYYTSKFNKSSILIVDGNGSDLETNSYYYGSKNKINLIKKYKYHGIGSVYTSITEKILNLGSGGEGKTMGLAPYGKENHKINIKFKLDGIQTNFDNFIKRQPFSDVLNQVNKNYKIYPFKEIYPIANKKNITNKYFCDWAYAAQKATEKIMVHLASDLYRITNINNLCVSGGVGLNSVANQKILDTNKYKNVFVFPACSDSGIPFGLAIWAYHNFYKKTKRIKFYNAYTGINYHKDEISKLLNEFNIEYKITNNEEISELIAKGNIIGHFFGQSEYGPRALGNRSILADPRKKEMRDYLNKVVKKREMFRPFAPAILEEECHKYFALKESPFMLKVSKCKKPEKIPSAIHIDNTARVQTVNILQNENFYNLIKEFKKITKIPVLLNTSFNGPGEPIVETPIDALLCFLKNKIDYLVLEKFIISRKKIRNIKSKIILIQKKIKKNIKLKENEAIKIITKNFSKKEFYKKKVKENARAFEYALNRPVNKIDNFLNIFNKQNKKLLIIGTNDHTNILLKLFNNKIKDNYDFFDIKKYEFIKNAPKIKNSISKILYKRYYNKILISSYEYNNEIINKLSKKQIFCPYDNSSRSIVDFYYIQKYKGKNKLHSKKII
jgi:carbamoyltransferase